jgi:hypothetical protein
MVEKGPKKVVPGPAAFLRQRIDPLFFFQIFKGDLEEWKSCHYVQPCQR